MVIEKQRKSFLPLFLFCLFAGLIATLWGYSYSSGNAEEQLSFIFRAMDPAYLTNDFFTNTFSLYGPRTLYSEFIAFFTGFLPLTAVLFSLTLLSNIAIAFFSSLTAQYFFARSKFSAFLAAAGVLTIKTFWMGYSNILYRTFLEPAHLAMPFLLLGFTLILHKRYIISVLAFGVAALFHPLLGLETSWLLLGISALVFLIQCLRKQDTLKNGKTLIAAIVLLAGVSLGTLLPYSSQASIPDDVFINLIAFVRHPHHYVPSTFELWQYTQGALYLLAFGIFFWNALKDSESLCKQKLFLLLTGGSIFLLCVGGYLFVEVWPSRIWTSAQMFRLPYLIKWFSIVLITGWIGNTIENSADGKTKIFGLSAGIGLVTLESLACLALVTWIRRVILPKIKFPKWLRIDLVILAILLSVVIIFHPEVRTWALFLLLFGTVWLMFFFKWKKIGLVLSSAILLITSGIFVFFSITQTAPAMIKSEIPDFALYDTTSEIAEIAQYVKDNTPTDAIFLTPPKFAEFRYMADRAIVVDFVAFAFQDEAMLEWYNRVVDCYGIPLLFGFSNIAEFNRNYRDKTDEELTALAEKYGADYLILFNSDKTQLPILFNTPSYKLVKTSD